MNDEFALAALVYNNDNIYKIDDTLWVVLDDNSEKIHSIVSESYGIVDIDEGILLVEYEYYITVFRCNGDCFITLNGADRITSERQEELWNNCNGNLNEFTKIAYAERYRNLHNSKVLHISKIEESIFNDIMTNYSNALYRKSCLNLYKIEEEVYFIVINKICILIKNGKTYCEPKNTFYPVSEQILYKLGKLKGSN